MRLSALVIMAATFAAAAILSLIAASFAVTAIEENSEIGVRRVLDERGLGWAEVEADGLTVSLSGTAPTEALRFQAISATGSIVDAARVIDGMEVQATADLAPPRFSVEILRNDSGISMIGLIPADTDRDDFVNRLTRIADGKPVADLLESADYPVPYGWNDALGFAVTALSKLPRSKVSVATGRIEITAISNSPAAKASLETELQRAVPPGLRMVLNIAAPRPVITPFTLRFLSDKNGIRFDACSAQNEEAKARILDAAQKAGLSGAAKCTIGLGVPTPQWAAAAEHAIGAVAALGGGTVTIADADITLVALQGTSQNAFDKVVGELETALPEVFALHAVLPAPESEAPDQGPPEFTATLSPEGLVQLRGRLSDENLRSVADSFAKARFGSASVYTAARIVPDLPEDWPVRVLTGLDALSMLANGVLTVTPDHVTLSGITEREDARAIIAGLLADKLGATDTYSIDITYREPPPPENLPPPPEQCEAAIASILSTGEISFEPGSANIDATSLDTLNAIADVLAGCGEIRLEIQGHTDSQGREVMNQQLSQARAQSVLNELRARRILTSSYLAKGYGETRPIQDNDTEEGREANRRIEFRLIRPEPTETETETTLESVEGTTVSGSGQTGGQEPTGERATDEQN